MRICCDLVVTLKLVYNPEEFEGRRLEEINAIVKADIEKINDDVSPPYKRIKRVYTTDEPHGEDKYLEGKEIR